MTDVKRPVLLNPDLHPIRALNVENVDLTLNSPGVSQATITLPPSETEPPIHSFVEIYNQNGFVGVFRVSVPTTDYAQQHSIVVRHGIDTLADSVFAAQTDFSGTVTQFLTRLLSFQTTGIGGTSCWQLGTCEDTATITKSINYDRLSDLLSTLEEEEDGYYFTYDQSSFPWTLNFVAKPQGIGTEFRRGRNIRALSRTLNDNDLCTQLILSVNVTVTDTSSVPTPPEEEGGEPGSQDIGDNTTTETVIRTYNNAAAQAIYGRIQRTADIDTHDDIDSQSFPEADAWAARFLSDHASPTVQMQIDGDEYFAQTGDALDETNLGYLCAVPLPEYNQDFSLRIVSIRYPNALSDPRHVTASLSTQLPRFSSSIASLKKAEAATAKAARSVARSAAKAKELKQWSMVVTDQQLALDGTGIMELYETGISMDAHGGAKIYSLEQGFQSNYAAIQVNTQAITAEITRATGAEGTLSGRIDAEAGKISQIVQSIGSNGEVTAASVVMAINSQTGQSTINLDADLVAIDAQTTIGDVLAISNGSAWIKRAAMFGTEGGNMVTINNGTVNAATLQVNSGGYLKFAGTGQGEVTTLQRSNVLNFVTGFGSATESGGQISIPYYSVGVPPGGQSAAGNINFNIAATQYFIDSVAAAEAGVVLDSESLWVDGAKTLTLTNGNTINVDIPSSGTWSGYQPSSTLLAATVNVGGRVLNHTFTVEDSGDSVVLDTGFDSDDPTETATTSQIVFLDVYRHGVYMDVQVGVRLSNGKQYKRWITDINTNFIYFGDQTLFSYDAIDEDYINEGRHNWYYR